MLQLLDVFWLELSMCGETPCETHGETKLAPPYSCVTAVPRCRHGGALVVKMVPLSLLLVASSTGQAPPAWVIGRHTDCDQTVEGKTPFPRPVEWKVSFADCLKMAKGKSFMYTNENWPASNAGCMVNINCTCMVNFNCTSANWDSYSCPSGACVANPKPPPAGKPSGPPPHAPALVHRALGSHMVLQREVPARIWGSGSGDITVAVSGAGGAETATATAAANGSWSVELKARPSTLEPSTITVTCPSCAVKKAVLTDVLFGDVYVCGGQSNMAFGLGQDINASLECPATANFPHIRHTTFSSHIPWAVAAPKATCTGKGFSPFSAVCCE